MRNKIMTSVYPSFLTGMGKVLDMGGTLSRAMNNSILRKSDFTALSDDWYAIGGDIKIAIMDYQLNYGKTTFSKK